MCEEVIEEKTGKKGKRKLLIGIIAAVLAVVTVFVSGFFIYRYVYLQEIPELAPLEELADDSFSLYTYKCEADNGVTSRGNPMNKDDFHRLQKMVRKVISARGRRITGDIEDKLKYPAYAMTLQSYVMGEERKPGRTIVYCNGYLYTESGNVYECDMDMSPFFDPDDELFKLRTYECKGITGSEVYRPMFYSNGKWDKDLLKPASDEIMAQGENISGQIVKINDEDEVHVQLDIKIKNDCGKDWSFEDHFQYISVGTVIDGKLYLIPGNPSEDTYVGVFPSYDNELKAGEEITDTFFLGMFGKLPPAEYRILIFGFFGDDGYCLTVPYQVK